MARLKSTIESQLIESLRNGHSPHEIRETLGIGPTVVASYVERISKNDPEWNYAEVRDARRESIIAEVSKQILVLAASGMTRKQMQKQFDCAQAVFWEASRRTITPRATLKKQEKVSQAIKRNLSSEYAATNRAWELAVSGAWR